MHVCGCAPPAPHLQVFQLLGFFAAAMFASAVLTTVGRGGGGGGCGPGRGCCLPGGALHLARHMCGTTMP